MKTLVFCTSFVSGTNVATAWEVRYERWLRGVKSLNFPTHQVMMVDDGSIIFPEWPGIEVVSADSTSELKSRIGIASFSQNLGRASTYDYPGWFRSFCYAAKYSQRYSFEKVIHIESDAYLISDRSKEYFGNFSDGWVALKGCRYSFPESALQCIAGAALAEFWKWAARPYEEFRGSAIEDHLPLTFVETSLQGDRYGEYLDHVPRDADWTVQTYPPRANDDEYYWWLPDNRLNKASFDL